VNKTVNFGTDGIRGHADRFPFTNESLKSLGYAIAKWSTNKYKKIPQILIGHDTRESCNRIKENLILGLQNFDINVYDVNTMPTPAVCKLANNNSQFDFGIIISASHNPFYDNGIKLVDAKTGKLSKKNEETIEQFFNEQLNNKNRYKTNKVNVTKWQEAKNEYIQILKTLFDVNFLKNKKIILDCANGSTYQIAPEVFTIFGAQVITINNKPNGKNINKDCGAVYTKNLEINVLKNKADIGFAFDGDGDRVIAVNKNGQTIDGDEIIALLTKHPKAKNYNTIVGTIMTNHGLDLYLQENNIKLIRTKVGDKYVSSELQKNNLFLGGESSGHIIMTDYLNTGDGIFTALRIAQTALITNNWELKSFKKTPQILINVPISHKNDLNNEPYKQIIENHKKLLKSGRIVVRYSGTENILRIMAEDKEELNTLNIASSLSKELKKSLEN
jgi:phosphoglucosamine mutase